MSCYGPWVFLGACTAKKHAESRLTKSHESNLYIYMHFEKYAHGVEHTLLQILSTAQDLQTGSYLSQVSDQRSQKLLTLCCAPPPIFHVFPPVFFAAEPFSGGFFPQRETWSTLSVSSLAFFCQKDSIGFKFYIHWRSRGPWFSDAASPQRKPWRFFHRLTMWSPLDQWHFSLAWTSTSFFVDLRGFQPVG